MRRDDGSAGPTGCVGNNGTTGATTHAAGPSIPSPTDGSITAELARRSGQGVTPAQGRALRSAQAQRACKIRDLARTSSMALPLLRQSIYSRVAGYKDINDAERFRIDPAIAACGWRRLSPCDSSRLSAPSDGMAASQILL